MGIGMYQWQDVGIGLSTLLKSSVSIKHDPPTGDKQCKYHVTSHTDKSRGSSTKPEVHHTQLIYTSQNYQKPCCTLVSILLLSIGFKL